MYARMYRDVRTDVQMSWTGEIRFCFIQFVFKFDFAFLKTDGTSVLVREKTTCHMYGVYRYGIDLPKVPFQYSHPKGWD